MTDERRITQLAAYMLARHDKPIQVIVLSKLIYLVERLFLVRTGRRFTFDRMYSLKHGPITSEALTLMTHKGHARDGAYWDSVITAPERHAVSLRDLGAEPPRDSLSEFEIGLADEVYAQFADFGPDRLLEWVHALPEYQDPGSRRFAISPAAILRSEGYDEDDITAILAAEEDRRLLRRAL